MSISRQLQQILDGHARERFGLGAIPLLPGDTGYPAEWLDAVLSLTP